MTATEFWFYHLEGKPLQVVLPLLLEKTLSRGWRACLRFSTPERLETVDSALWTYRDDSFLPHGSARDGNPERQPIFLTLDDASANAAQIIFLLEGATEQDPQRFLRVMRLFDDADEEAKTLARGEWREAKARGCAVSYWRQDSSGAWKKAG
jgi:DNA polymerase III subunit chi